MWVDYKLMNAFYCPNGNFKFSEVSPIVKSIFSQFHSKTGKG